MVMHGCLRPRGRNNGDRLVSTLSLSLCKVRCPWIAEYPLVEPSLQSPGPVTGGKEGLVMGRSCWAVAGRFATLKVFEVKGRKSWEFTCPHCAKTSPEQCLPGWLLCSAIVQLTSAAIYPLCPSCLFPRAPWIACIVTTAN